MAGANRMVGDAAMRRIAAHAFTGEDATASADDVDVNFLVSGYATPPVLAAIAADTSGAVVERSEGRGPRRCRRRRRARDRGPADHGVLGHGGHHQPRDRRHLLDYIRTHGLLVNLLLAPFRQLDHRVLALDRGAAAREPWARSAQQRSLGRGDIYGYRTPAFSMTTAQAYRPGGFGNQRSSA
ncbi:MAG: hypothetical protein U0838_13410 [Chloroflexota bacterium]